MLKWIVCIIYILSLYSHITCLFCDYKPSLRLAVKFSEWTYLYQATIFKELSKHLVHCAIQILKIRVLIQKSNNLILVLLLQYADTLMTKAKSIFFIKKLKKCCQSHMHIFNVIKNQIYVDRWASYPDNWKFNENLHKKLPKILTDNRFTDVSDIQEQATYSTLVTIIVDKDLILLLKGIICS